MAKTVSELEMECTNRLLTAPIACKEKIDKFGNIIAQFHPIKNKYYYSCLLYAINCEMGIKKVK